MQLTALYLQYYKAALLHPDIACMWSIMLLRAAVFWFLLFYI